MKNFLRISIVVLILIGLGFATYAMFFKPANKDEVYLTLTNVDKIERESKIDAKLNELSKSELEICAGYSYPKLKECMDEVFDYYYAYSQAVSKMIPAHTLKSIKVLVNGYRDSLMNLVNNGVDEVISLLGYMEENTGIDVSEELKNRYRNLIQHYRRYLEKYADLITGTRDFVVEYVFNNQMITDRESLLYDLMIRSLKKALSGDYNFNDVELKKISDDYMNSAINFTNLAMLDENGKIKDLSKIYKYEGKSVEYNGKLYKPQLLEYCMMVGLQFRVEKVGNYGTLYLGDSDVVVVDASSQVVEVDNVGWVTIKALNGQSTVEIAKQQAEGMVTFDCYVDAKDMSKLYFYDGDYSHLQANRKWINLTHNAELSGSQVIFVDVSEQKTSVTYSNKKEMYYYIDATGFNYKVVEEEGESGTITKVLRIDLGEVQLSSANYHENNFYSSTILKNTSEENAGEPLNYKAMIKCYNKIMKDGGDEIDRMINLSYNQKVAFVKNTEIDGIRIRNEFVQVLQDEMEYLLACCGFLKEVQ